MLIETRRRSRRPLHRPPIRAGVWLLVLFLGGAAVGFYLGGYTPAPARLGSASSQLSLGRVRNFVSGKLSQPRRLVIDIEFEKYQHLGRKRQQAIQRRIIVTEADSYVPARITADGETYDVSMRLKGDLTDHLEGDKWSFRIRVKGDRAIWGMKRFSIQDPLRSGYLREWIFHELLRYEGLIALRFDFVEVVLNGRNLGIFALEESFSKELVEHNQRREGPILKLDERREIDRFRTDSPTNLPQSEIFLTADIISFDTAKIFANEQLEKDFFAGRTMLSDFRTGKKKVSEVFDLARTARTFAILNIMNAHHAVRWKNIRFYYNPITAKIEPIAYNAFDGPSLEDHDRPVEALFYQFWLMKVVDSGGGVQEWFDLFFSDEEFLEHYFVELQRVATPGYLEGFFEHISEDMKEKQEILYRDGPLDPLEVDVYFENRAKIDQMLQAEAPIKAYLKHADDESIVLHVANSTFMPVTLVDLECSISDVRFPIGPADHIPGKPVGKPMPLHEVAFRGFSAQHWECLSALERAGDNLVLKRLRLNYRLPGLEETRVASIDAYPITLAKSTIPTQSEIQRDLARHRARGMLSFEDETIRIHSGDWRLHGSDLIFPAGFQVVGAPGTTLHLEGGASILSYSPIHFEGSEEQPFRIVSDDRTGQGLAVMSADGPSLLRHVLVSGQTAISKEHWTLTGAVSFYESEVAIESSTFRDNSSEDLVNIVRSRFSIEGAEFIESRGDALDVDFGEGRIVASRFQRCGNDCIDISGSDVVIHQTRIESARDKAISVGEQSNVEIRECQLSGSDMAIASKDGSSVSVTGVQISSSRIAFVAYQKKPEFSGASLSVAEVELRKVRQAYLLKPGSEIVVDGRRLSPRRMSLSDIFSVF